jgi:type IV pilus assembly protein PilX
MNAKSRQRGSALARRHQSGAALFVSMMILILLSMLALSASQVTSLQQKMATGDWADTRAFEGAEAQLRETEKKIRNGDPENPDPCGAQVSVTDPAAGWVASAPTSAEATYENLNNALSQGSRGLGIGGSIRFGQSRERGDVSCSYFRVSSADFDDATDPSAMAVVQSLFVP